MTKANTDSAEAPTNGDAIATPMARPTPAPRGVGMECDERSFGTSRTAKCLRVRIARGNATLVESAATIRIVIEFGKKISHSLGIKANLQTPFKGQFRNFHDVPCTRIVLEPSSKVQS